MAIKHVCSIYRPFLVLLPQKGGLKSMYMLQDFELGCSGVVKAACRYFSSGPFSVTPHFALGKVTRSLPSVSDKERSGLKCSGLVTIVPPPTQMDLCSALLNSTTPVCVTVHPCQLRFTLRQVIFVYMFDSSTRPHKLRASNLIRYMASFVSRQNNTVLPPLDLHPVSLKKKI